MYKQFQLPGRLHYYLCIVLAIMSNILLSSCGTTATTGTPTPIASLAATSISTPHLAVTSALTPTPSSSSARTVFLIMMENHNWSDIKNNPSASYINGTLLPMASYAEQYYNPPGIHPSEPNYVWLEAGTNLGILNDAPPSANHRNTTLHLVTLLNKAGISWKSYQEGISGTVCPLTGNGVYAPKHNPMVFFDDVTNTNNSSSTYCITHVRPFPELATDLQHNSIAHYNFITPDLCNDMHDSCEPLNDPVKQGDTWLARHIPTILNSQAYQNGGIVFITWDEGEGGDGPIGMIVLSPNAKGGGYSNTLHYTHSSTLRTLQEIFGVRPLLGDAAHATDLSDLFKTFP
ncbi:MAG TPA: alkaline phosphatase family protein [Ktedonobacteraceae bacterium]|nr:alkaline phosphatase family protein [Ktedonobacteraceae bacterium]